MMKEMQNEANRIMWYRRGMAAEAVLKKLSDFAMDQPFAMPDLRAIRMEAEVVLERNQDLQRKYLKQYPD